MSSSSCRASVLDANLLAMADATARVLARRTQLTREPEFAANPRLGMTTCIQFNRTPEPRVVVSFQFDRALLADLSAACLLGRTITRGRLTGVDVLVADLIAGPVNIAVQPDEDAITLVSLIEASLDHILAELAAYRAVAAAMPRATHSSHSWTEADIT